MAKKSRKGIPVKFGSVSYRTKVAAIGLKFEEQDMPIEDRESFLRKAQVECRLVIDKSSGSDVDGQDRFIDTDLVFEGVGEIHGYSTGEDISCTLSFPIGDTDTKNFTLMRCAKGKIDLKRTGDAEEKKRGRPAKDDEGMDEDPDEDVNGQQRISIKK